VKKSLQHYLYTRDKIAFLDLDADNLSGRFTFSFLLTILVQKPSFENFYRDCSYLTLIQKLRPLKKSRLADVPFFGGRIAKLLRIGMDILE